jgi:predicted transcriptional regulator
MGEHTDTFTESFGKEEGRRKRLPPVSCEGERERVWLGKRMMKKKGVERPKHYSK